MDTSTLIKRLNTLSLYKGEKQQEDTNNQLNEQQEEFFKEITSDESLQYVFISGTAGTGKSVLLREIAKYYDTRAIVVAFSAIAARNVNGRTIHSTFKLNFLGENVGRPFIEHIDVLIIDEISMVSDKILDTIDDTMKRFSKSSEPFGGKKVICFGDLFQLEPISNEKLDGSVNLVKPVFYAKCWKNFKYRELVKNMRQSEEKFIKNLNLLRKGDSAAISFFNRFVKKITPEIEKVSTTLVPTRWEAKSINEKIFNLICSENPDNPVFKLGLKIKNITISKKDLDFVHPADNIDRIFHDNIALCKGTKIMFSINNEQYLNGEIGIISKITPNFLKVIVGCKTVIVKPVEILFKKLNVNYYRVNKPVVTSVNGFPIDYAWACTIHKMQGITVDKLIIKTAKMFAKGQAYVAFSRVRHSDGISIAYKIDPKALKYNPDVEAEYQRLRNLPV